MEPLQVLVSAFIVSCDANGNLLWQSEAPCISPAGEALSVPWSQAYAERIAVGPDRVVLARFFAEGQVDSG